MVRRIWQLRQKVNPTEANVLACNRHGLPALALFVALALFQHGYGLIGIWTPWLTESQCERMRDDYNDILLEEGITDRYFACIPEF